MLNVSPLPFPRFLPHSLSVIATATGILLRRRLLTETSLIVHWLTAEHGRIATVAKGARRPKSPFHGKLDLFYTCDLSFARSARSDLHALREVVVRDSHELLRRDIGWIQQASYAAALIEQTTETESPLLEVFNLFSGLLGFLSKQPPKPRTVFSFEMKLLRELGLEPDPADTKLAAPVRRLLGALADSGWEDLRELTPTASEARELQKFLHGFLIFHLGKLPKGRTGALAAHR